MSHCHLTEQTEEPVSSSARDRGRTFPVKVTALRFRRGHIRFPQQSPVSQNVTHGKRYERFVLTRRESIAIRTERSEKRAMADESGVTTSGRTDSYSEATAVAADDVPHSTPGDTIVAVPNRRKVTRGLPTSFSQSIHALFPSLNG